MLDTPRLREIRRRRAIVTPATLLQKLRPQVAERLMLRHCRLHITLLLSFVIR